MPPVRPWLAHYDADVAHSIAPYPDKTLIDYLADLRVLTVTGPRCCSRERQCHACWKHRAMRLRPLSSL